MSFVVHAVFYKAQSGFYFKTKNFGRVLVNVAFSQLFPTVIRFFCLYQYFNNSLKPYSVSRKDDENGVEYFLLKY